MKYNFIIIFSEYKLTIYIEYNAGSMGSSAGIKDAAYLSNMSFAKSLLLKLKKMDVLDNIYKFNTNIKPVKNEMNSILGITNSGGTDINKVINAIEEEGKNAIVLTDADDRITLYSDKAFLLGVAGARFTGIHKDVFDEYYNNKQVIVFDGTYVMNIDKTGRPIKPE